MVKVGKGKHVLSFEFRGRHFWESEDSSSPVLTIYFKISFVGHLLYYPLPSRFVYGNHRTVFVRLW